MIKRAFLSAAAISGLVLLLVISCSEKVSSRPNYIFKKAPKEGVAAKVLGKEVLAVDLYKGAESEIYEAEKKLYEVKLNQLRGFVLKELIKANNKGGLSNDQFLEKVIADKVKVSEKEMNAFIKSKNIPKKNINAGFKKRLNKFLMMQKKREAIDRWVASQTKKNPVEVYIDKPSQPVFEVNLGNAPFVGSADAKVVLVEFSDFQCRYCRDGVKIINSIKKKYGDKVKIVFKQFPLSFHGNAKMAAEASLCANDQGGELFWKMHDAMFENQAKINRPGIEDMAKKIGLDMNRFKKCLSGGKHTKAVENDIKDGREVGVKSTPTFFINGKIIRGAEPISVFTELIDIELSR